MTGKFSRLFNTFLHDIVSYYKPAFSHGHYVHTWLHITWLHLEHAVPCFPVSESLSNLELQVCWLLSASWTPLFLVFAVSSFLLAASKFARLLIRRYSRSWRRFEEGGVGGREEEHHHRQKQQKAKQSLPGKGSSRIKAIHAYSTDTYMYVRTHRVKPVIKTTGLQHFTALEHFWKGCFFGSEYFQWWH